MIYNTWLEELGDIDGLDVLDLACGSGVSSRALVSLGARVVGVDISAPMLAAARKEERKSPMGIKYLLGDVSKPKLFAQKPFNIVTAAFLLHYADSVAVLDRMVKNIAKNLKSKGQFICINLNPDHPLVTREKGISHSSSWLDKPGVDGSRLEVILYNKDNTLMCKILNYYWSKEVLEESFKKAGFKKVEWIKLRMHNAGKVVANWKHLERNNNLVVIKATKS